MDTFPTAGGRAVFGNLNKTIVHAPIVEDFSSIYDRPLDTNTCYLKLQVPYHICETLHEQTAREKQFDHAKFHKLAGKQETEYIFMATSTWSCVQLTKSDRPPAVGKGPALIVNAFRA